MMAVLLWISFGIAGIAIVNRAAVVDAMRFVAGEVDALWEKT